MKTWKATLIWALVGLAVVIGLPVAGWWARRSATPGCALDGMPIDPAYRVQVADADGHTYAFCCPRCAAIWLERRATQAVAVTVTDEASGEPVDAAAAWFVRSSVVTAPASGNRIHAFRDRADAERHAERFLGTVLPPPDTPYHLPAP
jgi:endogenous inhibitor of DNA gyrase (YacG/DUF329 family)